MIFLLSFLIVAFGQPSFSSIIGILAAACGYALFWHALLKYPEKKKRFWISFLWFTAVSIVQLSWMSSIEYQGIYILFVWLFFSVGFGAQFAIFSLLIPQKGNLRIFEGLALASLWVIFEWSRFYFLCGFSWNLAGLALSNRYAIQFASIFGILGLSFAVFLINLLGLRALQKKTAPSYFSWGIAFSLPFIFGYFHLQFHEKKKEGSPSLNCLLVQPGLLPDEKIPLASNPKAFIYPTKQWEKILCLLKQYENEKIDLIVFPEAVVPFGSEYPYYPINRVKQSFYRFFPKVSEEKFPSGEDLVSNLFWCQSLSNLLQSEIVIGLDHQDSLRNGYNSAFHVVPGEKTANRYDKQILLPLAEAPPFQWLLPFVKYYGITSFFTPGKEVKVFSGKVPFSTSICYEETFPQQMRKGRLQGAKLFVNVTNDGWYPFSKLGSQQYEHARIRTVENGVPLLRACNTGITTAIDSLGNTVGILREYDEKGDIFSGILYTKVSLYEYKTLYTIWGNWGILTVCFLSLGIFGLFNLIKSQDFR